MSYENVDFARRRSASCLNAPLGLARLRIYALGLWLDGTVAGFAIAAPRGHDSSQIAVVYGNVEPLAYPGFQPALLSPSVSLWFLPFLPVMPATACLPPKYTT